MNRASHRIASTKPPETGETTKKSVGVGIWRLRGVKKHATMVETKAKSKKVILGPGPLADQHDLDANRV